MLVLNAGPETIEFMFNFNAANKKEGGLYIVAPGETVDIPEGAKSLVQDPMCGPGMRGLVILEYGMDISQKKKEGLQAYLRTRETALENEQQRDVEREAAGFKVVSEREAIRNIKAQIAKANQMLEDLENGNSSNVKDQSKGQSGRHSDNKQPVQLSAN